MPRIYYPPGSATGGSGSPGGSSGQIQYNSGGSFGGFTMGGDVTVNTGTGTATIAAGAVTGTKIGNSTVTTVNMATMTANTIMGNNTGSASNPSNLTVLNVLNMLVPTPNVQTASYTIAASDMNGVVVMNSSGATTVTLSSANAVAGFNCLVVQSGAGSVTFAAAGGTTVNNRSGSTTIKGQYGVASVVFITSSIAFTGGDM